MPRFGMLQTTTESRMPDNAWFYHLAYIIATAIYIAYAVSLGRRLKGLNTPK